MATPCPTCARCGATLSGGDSPCPRCLLELGLEAPGAAPAPVSPTDATLSLVSVPTLDDAPAGSSRREASTASRFESGAQLGSYRLLRLLGRGGFGEVWEAEDGRDQRRVALKLLTEVLTPEARERFRREGRIAASIRHPRVVFLYAAEQLAGLPALVMELLSGGTLEQLVERSGPLPWKEAVARILELAEGLDAAHEKGILHRDIKPSNCFLDGSGGVKIGDFGLSLPTEEGQSFSTRGTYAGTPAYSSPEQVRGAKLDVRSDLFSLGATFYFLLTGAAPFGGSSLGEVLARVLADPARPMAAHGVALPRGLERVVAKLLAKRPEARYRDYGALRAALLPYTEAGLRSSDVVRRPVAFLADLVILDVAGTLIVWLAARAGYAALFQAYGRVGSPTVGDHLLQVALELSYFFALELSFGRSIGKALFGLMVRRADGTPLDAVAALRRTALFVLFSTVPWELADYLVLSRRFLDRNAAEPVQTAQLLAGWTIAMLLRSVVALSMRRGNGYAGWHELLSRTRVVRSRAEVERPAVEASRLEDARVPGSAPAEVETLGPYRVRGEIGLDEGTTLLLGTDPLLERDVWIVQGLPAATERHDGLWRLQTLTNGAGSWEVFAAPDGCALLALHRPGALRPWREARTILQGAAELVARAPADDRFSLSRLWVSGDLRVLRLPFVAPGSPGVPADANRPVGGPLLLHQVLLWLAQGTLAAKEDPPRGEVPARLLPKDDREIAEAIATRSDGSASQVALRLDRRRDLPGEVSRPARIGAFLFWGIPLALFVLESAVDLLVSGVSASRSFVSEGLTALESVLWLPLLLLAGSAIPALLLSVLLGEGGLSLRMAGIAVVRRDGRVAGPLRRLLRAVVAWFPALLALGLLEWVIELHELAPESTVSVGLRATGQSAVQFVLLMSILLFGALYALLHPQGGLQDRIARTALVPR